jgi:hypothetical protein
MNTLFKNSVLSFFLLALLFCTEVCAQKKPPDIKVSVDAKEVTLSQLLEIISTQSKIPFSYNPKKIKAEEKLNYKADDKFLADILKDLAAKYNFQFEMIEDQIVLKSEKKNDKRHTETATFSGTIKDGSNGEALIGATLYVNELQTGTVTNAFGFFSLTLPKGTYNIGTTYIGYRTHTSTIDLTSSLQQDIAMKEEPPLLQEIVISSAAPDVVKELKISNIDIRPETVEERPSFFGEMDVVKSLEAVPGIKLHSDGSTFYYVRGGNRDQNLVLIDDAPIYNPSHILGVFSTIIPDAINDITLYKGDMPASYGGRLASVLDIRTKKGNDQHLQSWGSASLISSKLGIEGPIRKNASSFLVSARISRLKWFFKLVEPKIEKFNFYDFTGKVNVRINPSNRIFLSFYTGADHFASSNNGISWTNTAATLRWNHLFNDKLFLNTTIAASGYDYFLYRDVARKLGWNSHISNFNLKNDFSYFISPENELTFGMGLNGYVFNPGNLLSENAPTSLSLSVKNSVEFVMYANHEVKLTERWGINYGLRLSSWANTGSAFEFIFDANRNPVDTLQFGKGERYKEFTNLEPRATLSYLINENSSIKTSFSRNVQHVHLISNSISPFTSMEVWLPSSINIKPQIAKQATLGYYRTLTNTGTTISAELYYKKLRNQIDYKAHAETLLNPLLERELRFGTGTSYGLELLAKKDEGRMRGWTGYTWSRAKRKFADINEGRTYNTYWDRPHQLNVMLIYDLTLRWNIGMNWIYSTGAPYSAPVSFYLHNGEEMPLYGQKNNARLPDYHRLDVSASFQLNKNPEIKFRHSLSFSIFNVYGRKNPLFVNYNKTESADGTLAVPTNLMNGDRVTSQFYLFRFAPSLTYNFKWL